MLLSLIDSLGQIEANVLNSSISQTLPISNELSFEEIGTVIDNASSSCYTFENATSIPNAINYFVLIPLADNRFQVINLNICQANLSANEKANNSCYFKFARSN